VVTIGVKPVGGVRRTLRSVLRGRLGVASSAVVVVGRFVFVVEVCVHVFGWHHPEVRLQPI
jgi:hypothetical protein